MSHSINKEQYHERFHPPTPQDEHLDSAQKAHAENLQKGADSAKKASKKEAARQRKQEADEPGSE